MCWARLRQSRDARVRFFFHIFNFLFQIIWRLSENWHQKFEKILKTLNCWKTVYSHFSFFSISIDHIKFHFYFLDKRTKGFKNDKFDSCIFRSLCSLQSNEEHVGIPVVRNAAQNALNIFRLLVFGFKKLQFCSGSKTFYPLAQFNTEQAKALVVIITRMILILNTNVFGVNWLSFKWTIFSLQKNDCKFS